MHRQALRLVSSYTHIHIHIHIHIHTLYSIQQADSAVQFQVVVSYYEVYCEKVRDLLNPSQTNMKIRENNKTGFMIQDLTEIPCTDKSNVLRVIEQGMVYSVRFVWSTV
ncbi:hypothetical protein EON63_16235 [archaeon]|nr:MAG: hypothetical protein EON63_16235 [archaeon]